VGLLVDDKTNRKWASVALLSIVVPVALLASFRLTGVQQEPQIPQIITVETVSWNMTRPEHVDIITIGERVKSSYVRNIVSLNLTVLVAEYTENMLDYPSDGNDDVINIGVSIDARVREGFVYSAVVRFSGLDAYARVLIIDQKDFTQLQNLRIERVRDSYDGSGDCYLETKRISQQESCSLRTSSFWILTDENNKTHSLTVSAEVMFFNSSAWQKVIIPIQLGALVD
jgi:hypothetical protein